MKMLSGKRLLYGGAALCMLGSLWAAPAEYSENELRLISQMTSQLLANSHYRRQPLDAKLSERLFDAYFDLLDPNRIYFSEADVAKFAPWRATLGDALRRGDNRFAFELYDLYRKRVGEFRAFAEKQLKTPFDFTKNDTFVPDRRKLPRAADRRALEELWYLKLKNDVLYFRLFDRAMAEAGEKEKTKEGRDAESEKARETAKKWEGRTPEEKVLRRLRDIGNDIAQKDRIDVLGLYLNALAQVYGPHSNYMPPKTDEDFDISMKLSLTGIGATLTSDDGYIKVVSLVPGGPAAKDGRLKVEDRIIAVAQENGESVDVIDMPVAKAVNYIRGPENTRVTLTVLPGEKGRNAVPVQMELVRARVELVDSEAQGEIKTVKRDGRPDLKIGVIDLPSFYMDFDAAFRGDRNFKSCSSDVKKILEKFKAEKVDAVVMDLRRNGGGSLPEAIRLTGLFIPTGPVVQVKDGANRVELESDNDPEQVYAGPLVVLTSKLSASAAEIFSAAVRDCDRALLVGDSRTFGKGTVLNVVPLERFLKFVGRDFEAGSASYETAMFFRPGGGSVQQLGIEPDIQIPSLTEEMEVGELFLDNHLPWDSIKPVERGAYVVDLAGKAAKLKAASDSRVAESPDFKALKHRSELLRKFRDRNEVSLNEETRWKEYQQEKAVQEEAKRLYEEQSGVGKDSRKEDPVLDEAVEIAADFAEREKTPRAANP